MNIDSSTDDLFDETLDSNQNSKSILVDEYNGYCVSIIITNATSDFEATFQLQSSLRIDEHFSDIPEAVFTFDKNGNHNINVNDGVFYRYARFEITVISGSCNLFMEVTRKA